ncbi:putative MFS-type transporter YcaD [Rhodobacteraceae bacterium THAF1]|uniref:MFS transporter n=1 Tax=Palleronia sp. THAF1 TaxID=2587842 RepID=UPI000F3F788A|nr:MFS transporter [Palleronia sp. THAF1]QFU07335.1 putative MFS-type transporter YcaD [Palleronia sp. THAF1]VDC20753.1 putative MFS-type transporter YcaD [Rhodobacteraceae bacterium THAF1]
MLRQLLPVSALLLGSACLLFAGGINGLVLPVRGGIEGFTAVSLGLLGTGWAVGYVAGCLLTSGLVANVGHVRAFSALAALAAITVLLQAMLVTPWAWIVTRGICGFCFAGAAMIVESWLTDRAPAEARGRVFGIYTMVNLVASTSGQMMLTLGDPTGFTLFAVAGIFYALSLVPTAVSTSANPPPLVRARLDLPGLWRNSPIAVFAVFFVGVSNASFGALAPVFAERIGLAFGTIALFSSLPILAGAVAQLPVGVLSDRMDRRWVLMGVAAVALLADAAFLTWRPEGAWSNLALAAALGGSIFAMYPVIVAHANDHAGEGASIRVSGGLLLVFGLGSIVGPLAAGWGMTAYGIRALFAITALAHLSIILFGVVRLWKNAAPDLEDKGQFVPQGQPRATTPQTAVLAAEV